MTQTPERALELAELLESEHAYYDTLGNRYFDLSGDFVDSLTPILRHYAEILPKWQAVLDAEPVATVTKLQHGFSTTVSVGMPPWVRESIEHGTELIIKPAP